MNTISENIKKCRENANLSLQALAKRIVVTRKAISSWEHDESRPDLDTLLLIAEALNVDVMDLICDRRIPEDFVRSKPKRIRITIILSAVFLSVLTSVIFFSYADTGDEQLCISEQLLHTALIPAAYAAGAAALASLFAIWYNFRVSSKSWQMLFLGLAIAYVVSYSILLVIPGPGWEYSYWLYQHPILFVFPGLMVYLGCNKKA